MGLSRNCATENMHHFAEFHGVDSLLHNRASRSPCSSWSKGERTAVNEPGRDRLWVSDEVAATTFPARIQKTTVSPHRTTYDGTSPGIG